MFKFNISPYTNYTSKELRHAMTQMTEWLIHTFDFISTVNSITWRDNFPSIASHQILFVLSLSLSLSLFLSPTALQPGVGLGLLQEFPPSLPV
jgi:hypothetical protein